ncbi:excisionase [Streptomyces sp. M41(2017)]|nr:excisionase [Streptomyces sp. M41(2017)]
MTRASKEPTVARPQMLKLPEVLEEIGISRPAFYRMEARGQGPRIHRLPNGQVRISRVDLDAWWESCAQRTA